MNPLNDNTLLSNLSDLNDILPNPDQFDDMDSDNMLTSIKSDYCSIEEINGLFEQYSRNENFSLVHMNVRSLAKNFSLLNDILLSISTQIDIIGISETRLNENSVDNLEIENYNFFHSDSETNAGGVAIYVNSLFKSISRPDIKFNLAMVESCWIEIQTTKNKPNIIIGCIYKHPQTSINEFSKEFERITNDLKNFQIYILGDININFLNYNDNSATEEYIKIGRAHV